MIGRMMARIAMWMKADPARRVKLYDPKEVNLYVNGEKIGGFIIELDDMSWLDRKVGE